MSKCALFFFLNGRESWHVLTRCVKYRSLVPIVANILMKTCHLILYTLQEFPTSNVGSSTKQSCYHCSHRTIWNRTIGNSYSCWASYHHLNQLVILALCQMSLTTFFAEMSTWCSLHLHHPLIPNMYVDYNASIYLTLEGEVKRKDGYKKLMKWTKLQNDRPMNMHACNTRLNTTKYTSTYRYVHVECMLTCKMDKKTS